MRKLWCLVVLMVVMGAAGAAPKWTLQPQHSQLSFVVRQAGVPFRSSFERFTADIDFDPAAGSHGRFDVVIEMDSATSGDPERDEVMKGTDLLNVAQSPKAHYVATEFMDLGQGKFSAIGNLMLRDITRAVPIEFTFDRRADGVWLVGSTTLKRLDFDIGAQEWKNTSTLANEVNVDFQLLLEQ